MEPEENLTQFWGKIWLAVTGRGNVKQEPRSQVK